MIRICIPIVTLAAIGLISVSAVAGFTPGLWQAAVLSAAVIALWATGALPEDQTALIFFVSASLLGLVRADVIFSGFASTAFWLIFGGLVIGAAVSRSGPDAIIAQPIL